MQAMYELVQLLCVLDPASQLFFHSILIEHLHKYENFLPVKAQRILLYPNLLHKLQVFELCLLSIKVFEYIFILYFCVVSVRNLSVVSHLSTTAI
jgi:hypothetical protein